MALSNDLISQFVKVTNDTKKDKKESTAYGTVVEYGGTTYVQLDGSELLTPFKSTTEVKSGDRVTITIKNHSATAMGNLSSPSAGTGTVVGLNEKIVASSGEIDNLKSDNAEIRNSLTATEGDISELKANELTVEDRLTANEASIGTLLADNVTIKNNISTNAANINNLHTNKADADFANIDFATINKSVFSDFYSTSGIIKDIIIADGKITGKLVGVTITGDLIEGNTVKADRLIIKGTDGLYYQLNTNGESVEAEQNNYNSLNGSIITAKSITASKITVEDLYSFGATIGGFNIDQNAIRSGTKTSLDSSNVGLYLDKTGQVCIGDVTNYLKFVKKDDGEYELLISADRIKFGDATKGDLYYNSEDSKLELGGDCVRMRGDTETSLYSSTVNEEGTSATKSGTIVTPGATYLYSQGCTDIDPETNTGQWTTSEINITPTDIDMLSDEITEISRHGSSYMTIDGDIEFEAGNKHKVIFKSPIQLNGISYVPVGNDINLNSVTTTGFYILSSIQSVNYQNCPLNSGTATLIVESCGNSGQLRQKLSVCNKETPLIYERCYYESAWGEWVKTSDFDGKLLWSGAYYMTSGQVANLAEKVSEQVNGIVLVFSRYSASTAHNYHFSTHFVPKMQVSMHEGCGQSFMMTTDGTFSVFASKYLYISDDHITGHDNNNQTGTGACGITYENNGFVLRYVIGV